jgi:hypothetical protein
MVLEIEQSEKDPLPAFCRLNFSTVQFPETGIIPDKPDRESRVRESS